MKNGKSNSQFSLMIMTAFFIMSFLLLVMFGTGVYRNVAASQEESSLSRTLSSYLHTASKMNEALIGFEQKEGKTILTVAEANSAFVNRIYLEDGYLVEDFARADDELHGKSAMKIAKTDIFEIEEVSDTLLKIATSDGIVYISRFKGEER